MTPTNVFYLNARNLIKSELEAQPGLAPALAALESAQAQPGIAAGVEDFLANPFIQTALSILRSFSKNYKIGQAIKLLEEAGKDEQESQRKARKKK